MRKLRFLLPLVVALTLGACATSRPSMSYVAPEVTASDAQTVAEDAVKFLAEQLPPARTTLLLDPPAATSSSSADTLTAAISEKLRERGYGIAIVVDARPESQAGQGTPLRYLAAPLENGIVLRLQYSGQEASKLYPRTTDGRLLTNGPFTLREVGQ